MNPQEKNAFDWLKSEEPSTTKLVPCEVTLHTPKEIAVALELAWIDMFGAPPSPDSLSIILAQWGLETGRGKSCYNSNLGNIRPPQTRGDITCMQIPGGHVSEVLGGNEYFFSPPSRGTTFRAFESLQVGARFYLDLLHTRFSRAWPAVLAGNPQGFVEALHQQGYFTANAPYVKGTYPPEQKFDWPGQPQGQYGHSVCSMAAEYKNLILDLPAIEPPHDPPVDIITQIRGDVLNRLQDSIAAEKNEEFNESEPPTNPN